MKLPVLSSTGESIEETDIEELPRAEVDSMDEKKGCFLNESSPIYVYESSKFLFDFLKQEGNYREGHFHWRDNKKTLGWINIAAFLGNNLILEKIRMCIIDIFENHMQTVGVIVGYGMEGNIIGSSLVDYWIGHNKKYFFYPSVHKEGEHNDFEKDLWNQYQEYESILLICDIMPFADTLQDKINSAKTSDKNVQAQSQQLKDYVTQVSKAIVQLNSLQNSPTFTKNASNPQVTQTKQDINSLITAYQNLATKLQGNITPAGLETVRTELTQLNARFNDATTTAKRFETELRNDNGAEQLAQKVALLTQRIKAYRQANSKSEKMFGSQYDSMLSQLANPNIDLNTYNALNKQFQTMRQEINSANVAGKNLWQTLKEKVAKFTGWMSMTYAISLVTRTIRSMVTDVVELDTALVDLKKTFRGTETDLRNLYISANQTAKQLGVTTKDILEQASAWSRLGYSNAEAAETMAKNSAIFKTISPGMDLDMATDGLVSMMKAFDIEANDVLDGIMSKVNIIGNKFATDNSSIVEAMTRSSAAMAAANNTLEETIALNTASIEITRNAETTANAWKTNFYCLYVQKCA